MDLVYPYRDSPANGDDLRYNLRSVEKHAAWVDRVFIAGYCPPWLTGVVHVDCGTIDDTPERDQLHKLAAVAERKDMAEEFVWMNDDFYLLGRPHWKVAGYHYAIPPDVDSHYHDCFARACALLNTIGYETRNYEVHMPMLMRVDSVREMLTFITHRNIAFRSLYGNLYCSENCAQVDDVKLRQANMRPLDSWWCFSTDTPVSRDPLFAQWLRMMYPSPSRWELP